jgi:short-subunit dehydrogenase
MEDLARTGVRVLILDVSGPTFQLPTNVFFYRADVTSSESIAKVARAIRSEHGEPTVLINNAGVAHEGTILEKPEAQIRQTLEVNTFSHFLMVKEFLPAMVRANHGHVITIASMASFIGLPEMTDYCCSKASALAFHEGLRQELRYWYKAPNVRTRYVIDQKKKKKRKGNSTNCSVIHPSWVRTPMVKMLTDHEQDFPQRFMSVQVVSDAICKQVLTQNSGQIVVPSRDWVISTLRGMPSWLQEGIRSTASQLALKFREKQNRERLHK